MKAKSFPAVAICASIIAFGSGVYAQPYDDLSGLSVSVIGQSLNYKETQSGSTLDKDTGAIWGASSNWRKDFNPFFFICDLSYTSTNSATYDGALQHTDGTTTPYSSSTKESFFLFQADVGYKLLQWGPLTVSPCLGLGYRDWVRGADNLSTGDYQEDYHWFFLDGGLSLDSRFGGWYFGLLTKLAYPLSPTMETDMAGTFPQMD